MELYRSFETNWAHGKDWLYGSDGTGRYDGDDSSVEPCSWDDDNDDLSAVDLGDRSSMAV